MVQLYTRLSEMLWLFFQHKVLKRGSPIKSGGEENDVQSDSASSLKDGGDNAKISQMEAARERNRRRLAKKGTTIRFLV